MTDFCKRCAMLTLLLFAALTVSAQSSPARPLVKGAVFGGGRMADVGKSTLVEVKQCQAIGEVFGGNDIAGSVNATAANANGFSGAQVVLGGGSAETPIIVGSVYGGGNGYYYYPNGVGNTVWQLSGGDTVAKTLAAGDVKGYWSEGSGDAVATISGTPSIPTVKFTRISVVSDRVYIDSLFGGAKNAIVSGPASPATSDTTTSIRISGGTVFSVFGGNNFGGFLAKNSTQHIVVSGTKVLATNNSVKLGGIHSTGVTHTGATIDAWAVDADAHAICYLFGGGNKVPGQNVHIAVNGGQIDTCFGGGNSADVRSVLVDVNVITPKYTLATSPYTDAATYAYSTTASVFDIRCLFGGNNAADMNGLPTLNLTKGGIHNVYGGGNKGIMKAAVSYTDNFTRESITPTSTTNHGSGAKKSTNVLVNSANILIDTIYGGGQSAGTLHDTYVEIANGNVGVVYGGTNITGNIGTESSDVVMRNVAKTNVYIHGGVIHNTVFGASNGLYRCHNGTRYDGDPSNPSEENILFPSPDPYPGLKQVATPGVFCSYVYVTTGATIKGNVYSSGNMAVVGRPAAVARTGANLNVAGLAILHIDGGTIGVGSVTDGVGTITSAGNAFGGGNMGCVYGGTSLVIKGSPVIYGNVYGGNDKTGRVFSPLRNDGSVLEMAHTSSVAAVSVDDDEYDGFPTSITAGSGIALTNENADAYTLITGTPQIYGTVYGGGNGDYKYYSDYTTYSSDPSAPSRDRVVITCSAPPDADQRSSFVDINITGGASGGYIDRVFGGGNSKTSGHSYRGTPVIEEFGTANVYFNCTGTDPDDSDNNVSVGTIFGGNNNVAMDRVPRIMLLKGKVGNVYGGGNKGNMTGNENIELLPLSTYVASVSEKVVVTKNIYGGCNVADVSHDTYVEIAKGKIRGNIFGGNDLAGEVNISHVLINGVADAGLLIRGNVYGGGNGDYPFYTQLSDENGAYYLKSSGTVRASNVNPAAVGATAGKYCAKNFEFFDMDGRPYVDSTDVVLNGEFTMTGNVYGGGISGDCRKTRVLVDAVDGDFDGLIFGAGRGRVDNMGLRIGGTCHDLYIGVAQDVNNDGITDRDGDDKIIYGTGTTMGNVLDTAFLTVRRFKSMNGPHSAIFGGGQAGNVRTTMVKYEPTATANLPALYLGCLASDVTNAAIGIIDASENNPNDPIIDTVYGGNDFTGRVNRTDLTINSGVFMHVFGAGNGDYNYRTWLTDRIGTEASKGLLWENASLIADNISGDDAHPVWQLKTSGTSCADTVPYSMDVTVNINGGIYLNTVYGGGNMGLVGNRDMVPANMTSATSTRHSDIGHITVNIHDGEFHRHVFTGARGKADMNSKFFSLTGNNVNSQPLGKQLAYAQKILNMDGGHVSFSVYGGSEAVDDGFPYECSDKTVGTTTTLRPSTVLNITGGRIEKSVYGGGYQGNIYGSVYVNVGIDAVRDCPAWNYTDGTFAMSNYKPNLNGHSGYKITNTYNNTTHKVDKQKENVVWTAPANNVTLSKGIIDLEASVYNASDWGEAGANAYFNTRGVFGGVTNILIDGKGYYTSLTNPFDVDLPSMNINNSIIGAGTSTEGGDVNRLITIRHFGDYSCPDPSKTLFSIQRADKVVLDSVFINLLGEQDAFMAYTSPSYSFCRIDTLIFRVDNIVTIESPAIYIGNISSMRTDETYAINDANQIYSKSEVPQEIVSVGSSTNDTTYSTKPNDFYDNLSGYANNCSTSKICDSLDVCLKLPSERGNEGSVMASNVLMMRNGSYVKISPFIDAGFDGLDDDHGFGHVFGWMYLMAQDNTLSYVYAEIKDSSTTTNVSDGGFVAPCYCDNFSGVYSNEIDYTNVYLLGASADYRSWKVGTKEGTRVRNITLVANATPDGRLNHPLRAYNDVDTAYNVYVGSSSTPSTTVGIGYQDGFAYASTYLELPPAQGGNFYVINSVRIDQDNGGQMNLVDQGYDVTNNGFAQSVNSISVDINNIAVDPDYTFGLVFSSGQNFAPAGECWNSSSSLASVSGGGTTRNLSDGSGRYPCWEHTVISGNQYITSSGGYISNAIVTGASGSIPTLNFTLTYNTNLHSTITRDVVFTMHEFEADGTYVGPIEVIVTISTVIKDFSNLEAPVLAMFNEGTSNEYVRKVTIPASFQQRDIYIEGIEWMKDNESVYNIGTPSDPVDGTVYTDPLKRYWFNMAEYTGTPPESNKYFSVIVKATESTSENINNTLGWYHIENSEGFDVYKLAKQDYLATVEGGDFSSDANNHRRDSIYTSWDYDGDGTNKVTNMGKGGAYGKGIWVGTLDGRSTASIDVSLKFNGMYYYHNQFTPPLAWVRLKCHYYNTKTDGDGEFYINVKIRTRLQGDTIYMAPDKTLTAFAKVGNNTQELTMHAYGYGYNEATGQYPGGGTTPPDTDPNYTNITTEADKAKIKNNPNCYLQDFRQVMLIFDEGDVIDIMETIPITSGTEPISVMGDDYSTIQIIRYSGSHYKFPTLGCANYGPLIEVYGSGFLTMRNVWFNGSGCTRTKGDTNVTDPNGGHIFVSNLGGKYFYENHRRVNTLLFADAPMVYCHGNGNVSFTKRVILSNNFNRNFNTDTTNTNAVNPNFIGGGAIALRRLPTDTTGSKPRVQLGDLCNVFDNVVVDWDAATRASVGGSTGTADWLPHNYGAGVYIDGGELVLGSGTDAKVNIERNFYLKDISPGSAGIQEKVAIIFADETETTMKESKFDVYYLDTLMHPSSFALSNVYLMRKPTMCESTSLVRRDAQNDVVYFISQLSEESHVGISKWFPGYIYTNTRQEGSNFLDRREITNEYFKSNPRDTISIARIGRGKSNTAMVDNNYNAKIFFNDSSFYSINDRTGTTDNPTPAATSPSFANFGSSVLYSRDETNYPDYKDRVFIYRHTSLGQYNIYFQRCASFGKGISQMLEDNSCFLSGVANGVQFNSYTKGDSISYHWNKDATCALAMDTIQFRVGGGFFPYTYKWYDVSDTIPSVLDPLQDSVVRTPLHTRVTIGSNAISRFGNDEYEVLRTKAEFDTLVFRLHVNTSFDRHNYAYEVVATDLTGNCPIVQDVKVRVVKVATDHHDGGEFIYDYANFLQHRKKGAVPGWESMTEQQLKDYVNNEHDNLPGAGGDDSGELLYRIKSPGVDSSSFHDRAGSVPDHHLPTQAGDRGGHRRAGWTHIANCDEYDQSLNDGQGNGNADFSGKPYKGDGTCDVGDMTPRYLRVFRSYRVKPYIYPAIARGTQAQEEANDGSAGYIDVYNDGGVDKLFTITRSNMQEDEWHSESEFCPGEVIQLRPHPSDHTPAWEFIGWNFDPSARDTANFVVSDNVDRNSPVIFYTPSDYWWQHVTQFDNRDVDGDEHTATLRDYKLDYYGNVEIKTKKGLAWLISTVNGYNGQNAQTFHFNTIRLDSTLAEDAPIDMSEHKWTPLGNVNNPFEGTFDGKFRHITNIIVNEHTVPLVGMFGHTRGATIKNFTMDSTLVRGDTYVSAIVGEATENTLVDSVTIQLGAIFGEYTIGGFISHMVNSTLNRCHLKGGAGGSTSRIAAFGDAIYAGGFVGYAEGSTITNNSMPLGYINISQLSAIYVGAMLGHGKNNVVAKSNNPTVLNNNYAQFITSNKAQRVGGLVGYATGMDINNNYVYGKVEYDKEQGFAGGLMGVAGDNVSVSNSYFVDGMTNNIIGYNGGYCVPQKSTTFSGKGNNVILAQPVDGYTNLTRALNAWVRDNGDTIYNTWRSDLEGVNNGYPIFGDPDLIPVKDTLTLSTCNEFEIDGITFDQSGIYIFHVVDSNDFVDSTLTVILTVNYGDSVNVSDTITFGEGYEGHGFTISSEEIKDELNHSGTFRITTLQRIDSLLTVNGCDSIVVLTLYVLGNGEGTPEVQKLTEVKIYPNPTRGLVNVEGSDLESIEVYDNVSRRVLSRKVEGNRTTFDLSQQAAGSYYVRVKTANGSVVKKIIKK